MHLGLGNSQKAKRFRKFVTRSSTKFDGTDDVITTSADSTLATKTYSFWAKSSDTGHKPVFDHGSQSIGAFHLNTFGADRPLLWLNGGWFRYFENTTKSEDGLWHHWLLLLHTDVTQSRLFCDGVELAADSTVTTSSSAHAYTTGIRIGRSTSNYFSGSLDEFAIFDGDQTDSQEDKDFRRSLYNNGQPTKVRTLKPANLINSNLAHWFRMGEGKLGTKSDGESNLLFDQGPNGGLGSEKVTNGTFDSDVSGWSAYSGGTVTWNNGTAITGAVGTDDRGGMTQTLTTVTGAVYQVSFDILSRTSTKWEIYNQTGSATLIEGTALGSHSTFFTAAGTSTQFSFYAKQAGTSDGTVAWDNISVKEIQNAGTINGAAIQADGGTELITNGTYDTDTTGWTAHSYSSTTALSVVSGKLRVTSSTSYGFAYQGFPTRVGGVYSYTVEGTKGTSPSWDAFFGTHFNGAQNVSAVSQGGSDSQGTTGTVSGTFTATATTTFITLRSRNEGSVTDAFTEFDNVSVKEVTESVPKKTQNLPSAGSAKSMAFDATDEFVDTGFQPDFIHTDATVSFWCNMANFSGFQALGCFSSGKQFYVGFNGTAAGFALQATGKSSTDISAHITAGLWHHIALVADGGTATYYVDGVARDTHSYTPAASANPDTNFYIGAIPDGSGGRTYHMEGSVSEVAIWDTALDGDAVKALYNAGLPTPVTTKTGAYDIYRDNLKAYYKMGDATNPAADGTSNLLFDQTNPGVGSENVVNGTFDDSTGWTESGVAGTFTIADGKATKTVGTYANLHTTFSSALVSGKLYKITFGVSPDGAGNTTYAVGFIGGGNPTSSYETRNGTSTVFLTATAAHTVLRILPGGSAIGGSIDNVSVREVNGNTGTISGATIQTEAPKAIYALAPVDNKLSLNFDGTNDHLVTQVDSAAQPNNESRYYSWWYKSSSVAGTRETVFNHGAENTGMFALDWSSNRNLLYMASSVLQYWNPNSKSSDNAWHHWVLKIKYNDLTGCELWCDGVKQAKGASLNSGSMNTYTTGIQIGRGGSNYLKGSIDEFSIHEDLDDEAIRALFNRGRPIDISSNHGAYDTYSDKLLHWWRMGDAPVGQLGSSGDVLFQGLSEEDSELITGFTNGSVYPFDTLVTSGRDITSAIETSENLGAAVSNSFPIVTGEVYKVTFNLTYNSGTNTVNVGLRSEATGANVNLSNTYNTNTNGVNEVLLTATGEDSTAHLQFQLGGYSNSVNFSATDISVKRLRGQYIGPELVIDNPYVSGSWTTSNTADFGSNFVKFTRPSSGGNLKAGESYLGGAGVRITSAGLTVGATYKVSVDFETDDSDIAVSVNNGSADVVSTSGSGLKVLYFVPTHTNNPVIRTTTVLDANKFAKFSNISIKQVGGAAVMTNMTTSDLQLDTPY